MKDSAFIDTNVIIYALGPASQKAHVAAKLFSNEPVISTQVLSETINVLSKRFKMEIIDIRQLVLSLQSMCHVELISENTIQSALGIKERYGFSWYDGLIIASATQAGCVTLYSEDMQNKQKINGQLQIINPFK